MKVESKGSGVSSKLPRVTYIKAIDVWINTCLLFVIAALVEFAVAYLIAPSDPPFDCENQRCPLCQAIESNCCQCPLCVRIKCSKAPKLNVEKTLRDTDFKGF
ncbi:hypothetical protein X801_00784 [Opisthorchis viverrini]|uniref:Neurotransmitter-gated ion-channel transmembrane domain-containing protein n=1 Tax=Opisthorchis viverrini TaxID=6198 RepID=A0A1S8X9C3_OPIVI|nr:hypothetical protein X801_00784 [Opisthorchis viverrini]